MQQYMTHQEIFDLVAEHLLSQNCRSTTTAPFGGQDCMYRGDDHKMCAVGRLIKDDFYDPTLEGIGIAAIGSDQTSIIPSRAERAAMLATALKNSGVNADDISMLDLLHQLQHVHDNREPHEWASGLVEVGEDCGLDTSKVVA